MLPEEELADLADSIAVNGQRLPIVITPEGLILDGRNRWRACELAELEPWTEVYGGDDIAEYVIDANITRRNMTNPQRAMATAMVLKEDGRRVDGRWVGWTRTCENSRKSPGERKALESAGVVLDYAPNLAESVVNGEVALDNALKQAEALRDEVTKEQRAITYLEKAGAQNYLDLIAEEKITPMAAVAAYDEDTRKERERIAAERKNDEQQVQSVARALIRLDNMQEPAFREYTRSAFEKYPSAAPPSQMELHEPGRIRAIAQCLHVYANELENS